ncbi:hypothetical protein CQA62_04020 [Helicobacter cholecystus]|uniref:Uncharacterized protein n=1 Tax=Helicobacter cholecystus TaxID=45498 RepID=A0A3D8IUV5_9HELI|nr:AAA domain-containing protein [Helicobacter cholecystus]RDU69012.1 hypothetical protein CQA62_04020 [Helicobacter cholecystus]VEJ24538.1 AAA ATPase [Helicobacter cholecystus]
MVELLLASCAKKFYDYLLQNHKGVEKIPHFHSEFKTPILTITLKQKLFSLENIFLEIDGKDYQIENSGDIEVVAYDEALLTLTLKFNTPEYYKDSFMLKSDLKFLVKNVEQFFNSQTVSLPSKLPISPKFNSLLSDLSEEQKRALKRIFSHPLVYIWGAPGSGKTQRVLFEAIEKLINADKKIALIAPTNNALEQAIKTLIQKFDEHAIARESVLRLGIPTLEFSLKYPEICEKTNKESNLFNLNPKERIKDANVLAMTLDGFISRYGSLEVEFDHIFLDECAFAPLPKVCTLCACNAPLTLLGDHKQLQPVCEIEESEKLKDKELAIWGYSGIYLEHIFTDRLFSDCMDFKYTKASVLKQTHRYGNNLALILDAYIYKNGLKGMPQESELYFLDVANLPTHTLKHQEEKNINLSEVAGVKQIYNSRYDWAVITPFVNQRKLLIRNGLPYDKVFTIHGSQGQEFDGIIFSPVTLSYFLTDSKNIQALYALNVAISRMRKKLVLVCDYAYWIGQEGQFIQKLLLECKPYKEE